MALLILLLHIGHIPYAFLSNAIPRGCGGSMLGGGIAGPEGDVDNERAGDPGEYHHSRNLMKNIAVGNSSRSESNRRRGEVNTSFLKFSARVRWELGDIVFWAA